MVHAPWPAPTPPWPPPRSPLGVSRMHYRSDKPWLVTLSEPAEAGLRLQSEPAPLLPAPAPLPRDCPLTQVPAGSPGAHTEPQTDRLQSTAERQSNGDAAKQARLLEAPHPQRRRILSFERLRGRGHAPGGAKGQGGKERSHASQALPPQPSSPSEGLRTLKGADNVAASREEPLVIAAAAKHLAPAGLFAPTVQGAGGGGSRLSSRQLLGRKSSETVLDIDSEVESALERSGDVRSEVDIGRKKKAPIVEDVGNIWPLTRAATKTGAAIDAIDDNKNIPKCFANKRR